MCYTSGTSAAPKAVPHSFQSLLANPRQCLPVFDLKAGDRVLSAAPLTHAFGLFVANVALMAGVALHRCRRLHHRRWRDRWRHDRPTHVFVAPPHIAALLRAGLLEGRNLESLRLVVVSGSYCAPELKRALEDTLAEGRVIELWGMTETFAVLLGNPREPPGERHEWIGRPTAGSEARVVDLEGRLAPANVEGELHVRGCSVFAGYFDNASANERCL